MRGRRSIASFVRALGALALAGLGAWSCYNPNFVSGVTKCSPSGACPNDWVCQSGVCVDSSATGVGGGSATGGKGGGAGGSATGGHGGSGTGGTSATGGAVGAGGTSSNGGTTGAGGSGTGGNPGTGGALTGAGGTTSTGGATGTGGSTQTCLQGASTPPKGSLITDFSDAAPDPNHSGEFAFGSTIGQLGGTARYASGTFGSLSLSGGALLYTATLEAPAAGDMYPYSGFAVYMTSMACINASAYTGVAFTLSVSGTCSVFFEFSDSDHLTPTSDPLRGACNAASCFASQFAVSSATTSVAFSSTPTVDGSPTVAVDFAKLTGVQWQFGIPSGSTLGCSGSVTVDNIRFY